jgi:hypothetical protein
VAITVSERVRTTSIPVARSAVEKGSGIRGYDLDVSMDGGQHRTRVLTQTQNTSHTYAGELGVAYTFPATESGSPLCSDACRRRSG